MKKRIKLGQFGLTNDPRESKARIFLDKGDDIPTDEFLHRFKKVVDSAKPILYKEWKLLCVTQNQPGDKHRGDTFHRGDCRSKMWATYAETHRGICLRFDGNKLHQQIEKELGGKSKIFNGPVVYDNNKSREYARISFEEIEKLGHTEGMRNHLLKYWQENFLVKSDDWKTEYEYRWLIHNTEDRPEYVSIEGILTGVVVGADFPEAYLPLIKEFCSKLEIPVARIIWQNGNPFFTHYGERAYLRESVLHESVKQG